jgi:hypothetical protein
MLVILFSIAWLAALMFSLSLCRAAARGDDARAVGRTERIATGYPAEPDEVPAVGTAQQLPHDSRWAPRRGIRAEYGS